MWLNLQIVAKYESSVLAFTLLNQRQASQGKTNLYQCMKFLFVSKCSRDLYIV